MSPLFRAAESTDHEQLLALIEDFYREEMIPFDLQIIRSAVQELLSDATLGRIWLIEHDGHIAGYLVAIFGYILEFGGRQLFLDELYIAPEHQRRGIGSAALHFLEDEGRRPGARVLRLEVTRTNSQALNLYLKRGFELHDRQTMSKRL
ncbi:MAG: GNAT family N-acetyltransferase [Chthoniobacteraceae bacterium]